MINIFINFTCSHRWQERIEKIFKTLSPLETLSLCSGERQGSADKIKYQGVKNHFGDSFRVVREIIHPLPPLASPHKFSEFSEFSEFSVQSGIHKDVSVG